MTREISLTNARSCFVSPLTLIQIEAAFRAFAPVKGVKVNCNQLTGESRGFAFVEFHTAEVRPQAYNWFLHASGHPNTNISGSIARSRRHGKPAHWRPPCERRVRQQVYAARAPEMGADSHQGNRRSDIF